MAVVIKIRRGTTNQWTASNKILQVGELGIDTTLNKLKAGNGSSLWDSLPFLESALSEESIQDIVGAMVSNNTETDIVVDYVDDTGKLNFSIGANVVTTTSLANTLTDPSTGYIPIGDVGQADGVASLDANGKVPDSEIPDTIARDSEIPSLAGYATEGYVNSAIQNAGGYTDELAQDAIGNAVGTGLSYNDTTGAISVNTTEIQAKVANVDDTEIGYLNGVTSAIQTQLNDRLTSATASTTYAPLASPTFTGTVTIPSGASISGFAPLASPTFTGTIGGITKSMVGLANVDNTTDANKPVSTATQTALDLKLSSSDPAVDYYISNSGSGAYLVNGVSNGPIYFEKGKKYRIHVNANGHPFWIQTTSGAYSSANVYNPGIINNGTQNGHIVVELSLSAPQLYYACQYHSSMAGSIITGTSASTYKALADLANVNNTTDANKPVSTATQTALNLKANLASPTFTGTVGGITKSMVGLANVDNTSDDTKPVSSATQSALNLKLNLSDPAVDYYISNSGSGAYLVNGVSNGLITFEKGKKYRIVINASGHPFWIQTVSGAYSSGNVYSTGITNGGAQVGSILVELPQNAPNNLYYACEFHSSMQGSISVQSSNTITTNAQASNYLILPIDSGRLIEMSGGGTLTITDSASFPVGFTVDILQTGASQVTIAGNGFTPNATPGLKLRAQWSSATLIKRALNSWVVLGDLSV